MMPTMPSSFPYAPSARSDHEPEPDDLCAGVLDGGVVVAPTPAADGLDWRLPTLAEVPGVAGLTPIGTLHGRQTWAGRLETRPQPLVRLDWATCLGQGAATMLLARAVQTVDWRTAHRYCGACRAELEDLAGLPARRCPQCRRTTFVTGQPVALVAVWRHSAPGRPEVLLAKHTYGARHLWALVGGYVDTGENFEQTAIREVAEEVGLEVADLSYFGSEAWGINGPTVIATAFTARSLDPAAEPVVDAHEIAEARFFPVDALPSPLPPAPMVATRALHHLATTLPLPPPPSPPRS